MSQSILTAPVGHYGVKHVVKSETLKILTLRSTVITLGITVVAALLVTGLVAHADLGHSADFYAGFDPTQSSLTGMIVVGLTGGVFGALIITGEYSSGTIRTTLTATPRRSILLAAKTGVTAAAVVVFCEVLSFVSFFLGQAILSSEGTPPAGSFAPDGPEIIRNGAVVSQRIVTHVGLGSPGAFRAVWMTGLFIALLALMAYGLGLIFRSTAGAIAGFVGSHLRPTAGHPRHLRAPRPLHADQHPGQLGHEHHPQRRPIRTPISRRRVTDHAALCRCGPRHRRRAVCQTRRVEN